MKKLLIFVALYVISFGIILVLTGCSAETDQQLTDKELLEFYKEHTETVYGESALKSIGNGLYFDINTMIVYWWNGCFNIANSSTMPTAYYSENGKLCRYNLETKTIEELVNE